MKRIIAVLLLSFALFGCSSQEETPPSKTWSWVFNDGIIVEFPDTWQYLEFTIFGEGGYMYDSYGIFYMVRDGRNHESAEAWFYEEHDNVVEIEGEGGIRFLRADTTRSLFPDRFYGITDFVAYLVLAPNDAVFHAWLPVIEDIQQRELTFRQVLESATPLHDELNTFGFIGGLAVMVYPTDFEIVNWMFDGAPVLENDDLSINITMREEAFWIFQLENTSDRTSDEITDEDIMNIVFLDDTMASDVSLEYQNRYEHQVGLFDNEEYEAYVFKTENNLWFRIAFSRLDDNPIRIEDEEVILQMIDSILLNNRNSYYEPITLLVP